MLRAEDDLAVMYMSLPKDKTVYLYCHDGFRMSLPYSQLKTPGHDDVRLYNGGWSHWGKALELPVVEETKPLDEEFAL